jgi:hypothetical protein
MSSCGANRARVRGVLLGALLAVFMCSCGQRGSKVHESSPALLDAAQCVDLADTLRVDTIDFGRVRRGDVVSRTFALGNSSEGPIVVVGTETACGCLELSYPKSPVVAGTRAEATMRFNSSGYNYFPPRSFYIKTTYSSHPRLIVVTADVE